MKIFSKRSLEPSWVFRQDEPPLTRSPAVLRGKAVVLGLQKRSFEPWRQLEKVL